ncbi:hypothetical protein ACLOJK_025034 [Asimina triloba]
MDRTFSISSQHRPTTITTTTTSNPAINSSTSLPRTSSTNPLISPLRGTAVTMKKMLETSFPGVEVVLTNHPPRLPKRLLSKVVPAVQFGVIAIVMAGEHIFPRLGFIAPPPWYFSLRANRFGTIASTWLLGNVFQNFLQSSGAFEVYFDGELLSTMLLESRDHLVIILTHHLFEYQPEVRRGSLNDRLYKSGLQMDSGKKKRKGWSIFSGDAGRIIYIFSKLREHRFPGEIELRDLVSQKLATGRVVDGAGSVWS